MQNETIAQKHCRLAKECQEELGYVFDSITRQAGVDAIGGKKIDIGYLYTYEDGSALIFDVLKNTLKGVQV